MSPDKISSLLGEAWMLRYSDPGRALELSEESLLLSRENEEAWGIACATGMKGVSLFLLNRREEVFDHLSRSITFFERNPDHLWHARFLLFHANACQNEGDLNQALGSARKAVKLALSGNSPETVGDAWALQGMIFRSINLLDEALAAFNSSLEIRRKSGDRRSVASSLNQIAYCYSTMKRYDDALLNYSESGKIRDEEGYESDLGYTFLGMASVYELMGDEASAEKYYRQGYATAVKFGDRRLECHCLLGIGKSDLKKSELVSSKANLKKALAISREIGANELKVNILLSLSQLQEAREEYNCAVLSLKEYLSLNSVQGVADTVSKMHRETIGLLNDMDSSMRYARRIQNAILPTAEYLSTHLSSHFIINKPFISDAIGGDFYFCMEKGDKLWFAAADCTGHGIPGAMTSMLAYTSLRMAIDDEKIEEPGEILDYSRDYFKSVLSPDEVDGEINDGMDIAIISYDKKSRRLHFASANNPVYQVRGDVLTEHCGDRGSISRTTHIERFTTTEIDHLPGDSFYFMSDGIKDQFGGRDNKKFGSKRLKELILSVQDHELPAQKDVILKTLNQWMGSESQIDDMLLAGIRLSD